MVKISKLPYIAQIYKRIIVDKDFKMTQKGPNHGRQIETKPWYHFPLVIIQLSQKRFNVSKLNIS